MKQMRKALSLILALVLVFSLAVVPAFAADTEAESSTSATAYGQLHNGLLSEILSQIGIANDDNFIHGIVSDIAAGTLSEDQASAMVDQLAATGKISLTDSTTLLGSLTDSGLLDVSTTAQLLYELMTEQAHKQYDRSGNGFSDVPAGQWYTVAVSTLANVGAITGYSNGTFRPNQTITRAEAVVILNSVLGRSCDLTYVQANAQAALHFTDITPGAWYYADVIEASMGHTYTELAGIERWTALACPPKTANSRHIRAGSFFAPLPQTVHEAVHGRRVDVAADDAVAVDKQLREHGVRRALVVRHAVGIGRACLAGVGGQVKALLLLQGIVIAEHAAEHARNHDLLHRFGRGVRLPAERLQIGDAPVGRRDVVVRREHAVIAAPDNGQRQQHGQTDEREHDGPSCPVKGFELHNHTSEQAYSNLPPDML